MLTLKLTKLKQADTYL